MENIHETVEEIEQEYQILKAVSCHPNFPQFYGLYLKKDTKMDDQLWVIMEVSYFTLEPFILNSNSIIHKKKASIKLENYSLSKIIILNII